VLRARFVFRTREGALPKGLNIFLDILTPCRQEQGLTSFQILITRSKNILFTIVQTCSGAHPASCPMGTGARRPGLEADHSPPTSAEVKKAWIYTSTLLYLYLYMHYTTLPSAFGTSLMSLCRIRPILRPCVTSTGAGGKITLTSILEKHHFVTWTGLSDLGYAR
jgi:hypothetical protein